MARGRSPGLPPARGRRGRRSTRPYGIVVAGVGGTGVVTIGALIGMAAHLENKGVTVLDMTGMAQKGGAVLSHVRIAKTPGRDPRGAHRRRRRRGCCSAATWSSPPAAEGGVEAARPATAYAIINSHQTITGDFTRNPDLAFPDDDLRRAVAAACGADAAEFLDATRLATALLGDSRWRPTCLCSASPISAAWCRRRPRRSTARSSSTRRPSISIAAPFAGAAARRSTRRWSPRAPPPPKRCRRRHRLSETLDEVDRPPRRIPDRAIRMPAYAARYAALGRAHSQRAKTAAIARHHRAHRCGRPRALQADGLQGRIRGGPALYRRRFPQARRRPLRRADTSCISTYRAAALVAGRDPGQRPSAKARIRAVDVRSLPRAGEAEIPPRHRLRPVRPHRRAPRRAERQAIADYEARLGEILAGLGPANHAAAVELAAVPLEIRGFGHVKEANLPQRAEAQGQAGAGRALPRPGPKARARSRRNSRFPPPRSRSVQQATARPVV